MSIKNGILLSGGNGSRLAPLTQVINKHLLGVDGKFIIDYPVNTLKRMGVENLTVVLGGNHFSQVVDHLQDGRSIGMKINYVYQGEARGIAQGINICQRYVETKYPDEPFAVILGDNIYSDPVFWHPKFYGKARIILHKHSELHRFGVASLNPNTDIPQIIKIEEKPKVLEPDLYDQYAITGCYLFDRRFFDYFTKLVPSARGEYEITDIIRDYHSNDALYPSQTEGLWSDAGTHESIAFVNNYFYEKKHKA
jgi:glucose-1-phosphate thymidylyltransferase